MRISSQLELLPAIGEARAKAQGRAWFLVQDDHGTLRITDVPADSRGDVVVRVFRPQ